MGEEGRKEKVCIRRERERELGFRSVGRSANARTPPEEREEVVADANTDADAVSGDAGGGGGGGIEGNPAHSITRREGRKFK